MVNTNVVIVLVVVTLVILLLVGLFVLLLVMGHNRRNRHRAELAEVAVQHAEEVRQVEQEVLAQTMAEVGRDLHDNIGQLLTATRMGLNRIIGQREEPHATEVKATLDRTIAEVRRLSRTLNTDRWSEQDLGQAIAAECERVHHTTGLVVNFERTGAASFQSADRKLVLYRIFQELLNNALKHAVASRIDVSLEHEPVLRLTVSDDGKGFAPASDTSGQGLSNIRRRAALIGYHCDLVSAPGQGTRVSIHEP